MTSDTLNTMLQMMGIKIDQKELDEIIEVIDEDGSGTIEFDEFLILAEKFMTEDEEEDSGKLEQELKEAFRLYDTEGQGYITNDVLRTLLSELDSSLTDEDFDVIIEL